MVNGHPSCRRCANAWYELRRRVDFSALDNDARIWCLQMWMESEKLVSSVLTPVSSGLSVLSGILADVRTTVHQLVEFCARFIASCLS